MSKPQISNEKKLTLLLLCWLFGIIAIHRFYTNKYVTGVIQIVILALAGVLGYFKYELIPAIIIGTLFLWWIVDIMRIIMGKFTDKEGKLIKDWV